MFWNFFKKTKIVDTKNEELEKLKKQARKLIVPKVKHYAQIMNVEYGRIAIRAQKTRFGSCSSKGNLNFNCVLALMPEEINDYVVVHELAHLKQMNHSKLFWLEVEAILPDYKKRRKWLKENGRKYLERMGIL